MRCFYHPDRDAFGICKNCGKGVCAESAAELDNGLACVGRCEARVEQINVLMDKSTLLASKSGWFMGPWLLVTGAAFALFGGLIWFTLGDPVLSLWMVALGVIFASKPSLDFVRSRAGTA